MSTRRKKPRPPERPTGRPTTADARVPGFPETNGARQGAARAVVLHPAIRQSGPAARSADARLAEAEGLALAIGLTIVHGNVITVTRRRPATLFGKGKVEEFAEEIALHDIAVAIVDTTLTPVQQRNLERAWHCKVIDRHGLILEIFGARARTKEGQLQVELAALSYQRSRLVRSWTHLERQRGGFGFLGGPGESQLEIDRRLITERITRIKAELEQVKRTRAAHRKARRRVPFPVIALVGYTNAGKSTLFNRLTESTIFAKDLLFATLDPTMRKLRLGSGREVILSDTVGFISDLPPDLVVAFRATLEEVTEADLIVHVRDIAHPDSAAQRDDVEQVLRDLGLEAVIHDGLIEVLNKIDLLDCAQRDRLDAQLKRNGLRVAVSAVTGEGVEALTDLIDTRLEQGRQAILLHVDLADGAALAWLYDHGRVVSREDDEHQAHLTVHLDPADLARFERRYGNA